jgi:DNA-binding CsgD family transcriptional regulator
MPRLSAAPITLTPEQDQDLRRLSRARKTPQKLAERADMILLSAAGMPVREIGRELGVWPKTVRHKTVRHWRACWLSSSVETSVAAKLADAARPGTPATFTPEQICAIMALACEPPEQSNLPLSHWSQSELAREAVRRGIVDSISHGSVGRFLKKKPTSSHTACAAG